MNAQHAIVWVTVLLGLALLPATCQPATLAGEPAGATFDPAVLHTRLDGSPQVAGEFDVIVAVRDNTLPVLTYALLVRFSPDLTFNGVYTPPGGFSTPPTTGWTPGSQRTVSSFDALSAFVEGDLFGLRFSSPGPGQYSIALDPWGPTPLVAKDGNDFVHLPFTCDDSLTRDLGGPAAVPAKIVPIEYPGDIEGDSLESPPERTFPRGSVTCSLLLDSDGDGLDDNVEDANGNLRRDAGETGARDADSDDDGIEDGVEIRVLGSDPLDDASPGAYTDADDDGLPADVDPDDGNADTDGDGFQDAYEAAILDVSAASDSDRRPPLGDVNNDGFNTLAAPEEPHILAIDTLVIEALFIGNIGPDAPIFGDGWFVRGDVNRDGAITNADAVMELAFFLGELPYHPMPLLPAPDYDKDGLADVLEEPAPPADLTNIWLPDSDGDGLLDGEEDADRDARREPEETDPRDRDSDGDGVLDGIEAKFLGSDPTDPGDPAGSPVDADRDGYPAPHDLFDTNPDADRDGYTDGYEAAVFGTWDAPLTVLLQPGLGDVNRDGAVGNLDALMTMSFFLNLSAPEFLPGLADSDVNLDGVITNLDALATQAFFLRAIPLLPAGVYGSP